jgi:hypothetical protein
LKAKRETLYAKKTYGSGQALARFEAERQAPSWEMK